MITAEIVFWDVQHGLATYLKTPNGKYVVIDLGTGDYSGKNTAFSPLQHLYNQGVSHIDYLIITHPHLDHIDDILTLDKMTVGILSRPSHLSNQEILNRARFQDKAKFERYCSLNSRYTGSVTGTSNDPEVPANFGGVSISTFIPKFCNTANLNNHSIITVIEYAGTKIVIPGDNECCSFDELLQYASFKKTIQNADILLAPHHGRESGHHVEFLNLANPHLTIVSDGSICDTSANWRYSQSSKGMFVYKSSVGKVMERKCLTTNSDGEVRVIFGYNDDWAKLCLPIIQ